MEFIKELSKELVSVKEWPEFKAGDTITVYYTIKEGEKERTQFFQGVDQLQGLPGAECIGVDLGKCAVERAGLRFGRGRWRSEQIDLALRLLAVGLQRGQRVACGVPGQRLDAEMVDLLRRLAPPDLHRGRRGTHQARHRTHHLRPHRGHAPTSSPSSAIAPWRLRCSCSRCPFWRPFRRARTSCSGCRCSRPCCG